MAAHSPLFPSSGTSTTAVDAGRPLIQRCGGLAEREMEAQVLDTMALERERRHNHQGTDSGARVHRRQRAALQPQPDRHAGTRRLLLRGQRSLSPARAHCWWSTPRGVEAADGGQLLHGDRSWASRCCRS